MVSVGAFSIAADSCVFAMPSTVSNSFVAPLANASLLAVRVFRPSVSCAEPVSSAVAPSFSCDTPSPSGFALSFRASAPFFSSVAPSASVFAPSFSADTPSARRLAPSFSCAMPSFSLLMFSVSSVASMESTSTALKSSLVTTVSVVGASKFFASAEISTYSGSVTVSASSFSVS